MAGPWEQFAAPPPAEEAGPWSQFQQPAQPPQPQFQPPPDFSEPAVAATVNGSRLGDIWRTFSSGFNEGFGAAPLGLSDADVKFMQKHGVFRTQPGAEEGAASVLRAFNETVLYRGAQVLDAAQRLPGALYHGVGDVALKLGVPRDIVALPEAFQGSIPEEVQGVVRRPSTNEGAEITALSREEPPAVPTPRPVTPSDVARARELGVVGPPKPTIVEGTPAQAAANLIQPTVAYHGSPHNFDAFDISRIGTGEGAQSYGHGLYFAENEAVAREYQEQLSGHTKANIYKVRIHADPEKFIDLDRRIIPQLPPGAKPLLDQESRAFYNRPFDSLNDTAQDFVAKRMFGNPEATKQLSELGVSGLKYLDQGSRGAEIDGTRNFVVFNDKDVEITHKNGEPVAPVPSSPQRAVAAERTQNPDDVLRGPEPGGGGEGQSPWMQRLLRIKQPDEIKGIIQQAATENGEFLGARAGEIPLAHVEGLSQATGIPLEEITPDMRRGMGRLMRNDDEVRTAFESLITLSQDVQEKMRTASATGSEADLIALQEARMRHSMGLEQVAGLRAEWGRTGQVMQEFMGGVKDAKSLGDFLAQHGETIEDLRNMARAGSALDPRTQLPKFLYESRKPGFFDKFLWYWVNALISGPVTHLKYVGANAAFGAFEHAAVTPVAAAIGKAKEILTGTEREHVLGGEAMAGIWGMIAGTPDAFVAAYKAAKSGMQTPLKGQLRLAERLQEGGLSAEDEAAFRKAIDIPQNRNPFTQQKPIGGVLGKVIGVPSHAASAIHSFFNFLGERAEIEKQAYRNAAREGLSPTEERFWQRRGALASNPTDDMVQKGIESGYRLTFITELGPKAKAVQSAINKVPALKLIAPFMHIPVNIFKRGYEMTPAALFDKDMRDALFGRKGSLEQDQAVARVIAGSALMTYVGNLVLNDRATGNGPTDPDERRRWLLTHQPNSIRIGDHWVSYDRFGPIGLVFGMGANVAEMIPHMKDEQLDAAAVAAVKAASHTIIDETGMQGLVALIEAVNDPDRKGARYVGTTASSFLPYSSLLRQTASFIDPYVREQKTVVDSIGATIPGVRTGLMPKRDVFGRPIDNPAFRTVLRTRGVSDDPVALEMQALKITPTLPQDRIGGVKLTPELYDQYQATAGPLVRMTLDAMVNSPGWKDLPDYVRETAIRNVFKSSRASAAAAMQMHHPELIQEAIKQRRDHITGVTHTSRPKAVPAGLQ